MVITEGRWMLNRRLKSMKLAGSRQRGSNLSDVSSLEPLKMIVDESSLVALLAMNRVENVFLPGCLNVVIRSSMATLFCTLVCDLIDGNSWSEQERLIRFRWPSLVKLSSLSSWLVVDSSHRLMNLGSRISSITLWRQFSWFLRFLSSRLALLSSLGFSAARCSSLLVLDLTSTGNMIASEPYINIYWIEI